MMDREVYIHQVNATAFPMKVFCVSVASKLVCRHAMAMMPTYRYHIMLWILDALSLVWSLDKAELTGGFGQRLFDVSQEQEWEVRCNWRVGNVRPRRADLVKKSFVTPVLAAQHLVALARTVHTHLSISDRKPRSRYPVLFSFPFSKTVSIQFLPISCTCLHSPSYRPRPLWLHRFKGETPPQASA
jgi:hypothetical protein